MWTKTHSCDVTITSSDSIVFVTGMWWILTDQRFSYAYMWHRSRETSHWQLCVMQCVCVRGLNSESLNSVHGESIRGRLLSMEREDKTGQERKTLWHRDRHLLLSSLEESLTGPTLASILALRSPAGPPFSIKPMGRSLAPHGWAAMMVLFNSLANAMVIVWV